MTFVIDHDMYGLDGSFGQFAAYLQGCSMAKFVVSWTDGVRGWSSNSDRGERPGTDEPSSFNLLCPTGLS